MADQNGDTKTEAENVAPSIEPEVMDETEESVDKAENAATETKSPDAKKEVSSDCVEPTDIEQKIIRQIEYYFGNLNLPRDRFLQGEIKQSEEGWIPLTTMIKFKRLEQLSTDLDVIVAALFKSQSGLIEISDDKLSIRRNPSIPIPENIKDTRDLFKSRSVYAKGFPDDVTIDIAMKYFELAGKTEQVQLRRNKDKTLKNSCFAIYETEEAAKTFLTMEEMVKLGETEMKRMMKDEYFKKKSEELKAIKKEESRKKQEQRDEYLKQKEDDKKKELSDKISHGAVLHLKNIPEGTTREDLKEIFQDHGTVAWAEFAKGETEGKLRFEGTDSAKSALEKALAANDGKVKIGENELECHVLEGDEELKYWNFMNRNQKGKSGHSGAGNRYNRANQFNRGSQKRKSGRDQGESKRKVVKQDDD